ncbi:MAG TPA: hypothetical protein VOB72_06935 [Candidatus Dormibacteraeota bacterium]|nr:hypothetical protein [Candidatus Dormibacteraeota bacterium]
MTEQRDTSALDAVLAATKEAAAQAAEASGGGKSKKSQATELVDIANELAVELWEDPAGDAWITFAEDDHHEHWKIRSRAAGRWLRGEYFRRHQKAVGNQGMQDALGLLEAHAHETRQQHDTYVRVAELDGRVYIDLCDLDWNAVEIEPGSWQVVSKPPVRFRRARGMRHLPVPASDGDINELRRFVNVASDDDWRLLVAWMLAAWRGKGPYPILILRGEQGSAKSTTARNLRALVDPNTSPLRAEPKELRDLMITATNSWCTAFDNLSRLPFWLSDSLCRLATGGGFAIREHYENDQEVIFDVSRPALITGIEDVVTNADLLNRVLTIDLPRIPEDQRRTERELEAAFDEAQPRILGGILTALCRTLAVGIIKVDVPRMADFAEKSVAAERALGWPSGSFLSAYAGNREMARETSLDNSLIAGLVRKIAEEGGFTGRASQLLDRLEGQVDEQTRKRRDWPKKPNHLSGLIRRLTPDLHAAGWADVRFGARTGAKGTQITILKVRSAADTRPSRAEPAPEVSIGVDSVDGQEGDRHPISGHFELAGVDGVGGVDHFPQISSRGVGGPSAPQSGDDGTGWDDDDDGWEPIA